MGVDAARGIGEALKKHPEFKKALFKDLFTGRMKAEIPKALEHLGKGMIAAGAQLTVLDCSDNALGPNGMAGLVDLLKSPTCYSLQVHNLFDYLMSEHEILFLCANNFPFCSKGTEVK